MMYSIYKRQFNVLWILLAAIAIAWGCEKSETTIQNPISKKALALPVHVHLAPGAAEHIPMSGVLITLTRMDGENTEVDKAPKRRQYRGWVRQDGKWYGPKILRGRYRVSAAAEGMATSVGEVLDYTHPNQLPRLKLNVSNVLNVVVRLYDNSTKLFIDDADVTLSPVNCKTDCDALALGIHRGSYVLNNIPPGTYALSINSPGYVAHPVRRVALNDAISVIERSLDPGTFARGQVVMGGNPLPGVKVVASKDHGVDWVETITDEDGAFELGPMNPGSYYLIAVSSNSAPYYEPKWQVLEDGNQRSKTIELLQGAGFEGVITDDAGNPLSGVKIYAEPQGAPLGGLRVQEAVSGADGTYRFDHLGEDVVHLRFSHPNFISMKQHYAALLDAMDRGDSEVQLGHQSGEVTIQILDEASGQPLKGVALKVDGFRHPIYATDTNERGAATFIGSLKQAYTMVATLDGFMGETFNVHPQEHRSVQTVRLHKLARLSGQARIKGTNWMPNGAQILLRQGKTRMSSRVINGSFDLGRIQPGDYEISLRLFDMGQSKWQPMHIESGADISNLSLTLPPIDWSSK
ncbi:MAG: hypothetical protein QNJ97_23655 [Myxococcota bacterium]|nr:hypothetical protein [Myxococcota bacterium]